MLEEPRPEDVGGHFGEDAAFLLIFLAVGIIVVFARSISTTNTGIACITYLKITKSNEMKIKFMFAFCYVITLRNLKQSFKVERKSIMCVLYTVYSVQGRYSLKRLK